MKKLLNFLLVLAIIASCALLPCLVSCNDAESDGSEQDADGQNSNGEAAVTKDYEIGVIADSQVMPAAAFYNSTPWDYYYKTEWIYRPIEHALEYSEAIFNSAIDEYINSGIKYMLLIGDLTNDGDPRAIEIVKQGCAKLKAAGIAVYTTLGLCDRYGVPTNYYKNSQADIDGWDADANFKSDFYQYMDATPCLEDTNSLSYAVNVPDSDITIISLDSTANLTMASPSTYNVHCILQNLNKYKYIQNGTEDLINWLQEALLTAKMANRTPIVTTYMPMDYNFGEIYGRSTTDTLLVLNRYEEIQALCAEYGVKAVFNGQLHMPCDATYTAENGTTFQEISTGSLCTYPLPITTYDVMSNKTFVRHIGRMSSVKEEYLPSYTTADDRALLTSNAVEFAKQAVIKGFVTLNEGKVSGADGTVNEGVSYVKKAMTLLGIYKENNEDFDRLADALNGWLSGVNDIPIYGAEDSVESVCAHYGITIPKTDYTTILDFMSEMTCSMYDGTFNMQPDSDNYQIFKYSFYTGIYKIANPSVLTLAHNVDATIIDCDLTPIVDKIFTDDIMDISMNDLVRSFMSILSVRLSFITVGETQDILDGLSKLLPMVLCFLPDSYNAENQTMWGIPYMEIANFEKGEIYGEKFFRAVGGQFIYASCVKYK